MKAYLNVTKSHEDELTLIEDYKKHIISEEAYVEKALDLIMYRHDNWEYIEEDRKFWPRDNKPRFYGAVIPSYYDGMHYWLRSEYRNQIIKPWFEALFTERGRLYELIAPYGWTSTHNANTKKTGGKCYLYKK